MKKGSLLEKLACVRNKAHLRFLWHSTHFTLILFQFLYVLLLATIFLAVIDGMLELSYILVNLTILSWVFVTILAELVEQNRMHYRNVFGMRFIESDRYLQFLKSKAFHFFTAIPLAIYVIFIYIAASHNIVEVLYLPLNVHPMVSFLLAGTVGTWLIILDSLKAVKMKEFTKMTIILSTLYLAISGLILMLEPMNAYGNHVISLVPLTFFIPGLFGLLMVLITHQD